MKKHYILSILILFLTSAQTYGQENKLTNQEIIQMVNLGLSTEIIKAKLATSTCQFDTSVPAIQALKKANVPDIIIVIMMQSKCATDSSEKDKKQEDKTPTHLKEFVYATITDLKTFPERYVNKVVYFRAKVEDVRREQENAFVVGVSSGSGATFEYIPPIFSSSNVNILIFGDLAEILIRDKAKAQFSYGALFGGEFKKIGNPNREYWALYLFDIEYSTTDIDASLIGRVKFDRNLPATRVKYLIDNEANINIQDKVGLTPLMIASRNGNEEAVKQLILLKAELNKVDAEGKSALIHVVEASSVKATTNQLYSSQLYSKPDFEGVLKQLIRAGADTKVKDKKGLTASDYANNQQNKDIKKLLLTN
jgi:hypothetical protein